MNRNRIVLFLIIATGVFFTLATIIGAFTDSNMGYRLVGVFFSLGFITGISAITSRFLIKD